MSLQHHIKIEVLESGSVANGYLISDSHSTLLLEIGIRVSDLIKKYKVDINKIDGCLVSHEHKDHARDIKSISNFTTVYSSQGTLEQLNVINDFNFVAVEKNTSFKVGTFNVIAFSVEHDAVDPIGFLIQSEITKEKILFITDSYYIKHRFKDIDYLLLECNYQKELLETSPVADVVKKRIVRSHFGLHNVLEFLRVQDTTKLKKVFLIHLSKNHTNPKVIYEEVAKVVGCEVIVCK